MPNRYFNYPLKAVFDTQPEKQKDVLYLTQLYFPRLIRGGFYDRKIEKINDLLEIIFDPMNLFYLIVDTQNGYQPVGHALLNHFIGKTAMVHFGMAKDKLGPAARDIARDSLRQVFDVAQSLIGIIPVSNRLAIQFAKLMGFNPLIVLRETCKLWDGRHEDGELLVLTREAFYADN